MSWDPVKGINNGGGGNANAWQPQPQQPQGGGQIHAAQSAYMQQQNPHVPYDPAIQQPQPQPQQQFQSQQPFQGGVGGNNPQVNSVGGPGQPVTNYASPVGVQQQHIPMTSQQPQQAAGQWVAADVVNQGAGFPSQQQQQMSMQQQVGMPQHTQRGLGGGGQGTGTNSNPIPRTQKQAVYYPGQSGQLPSSPQRPQQHQQQSWNQGGSQAYGARGHAPFHVGSGYHGHHGTPHYGSQEAGRGGGGQKRVRGEELETGTGKGKGKGKGAKASRREEGRPSPAVVSPAAAVRNASRVDGDGVPYANSPGTPGGGKKKKKKRKADKVVSSNPGIGPPTRPPPAVVDVDRSAGIGHWKTLNKAGAIAPLPGSEHKKRAGGRGGKAKNYSAMPRDRTLGSVGKGDDPQDPVAYARKFPGGAEINLKGFDIRGKSAVSAAFELCVAMDPKARPKFEPKGGVKSKTGPFTVQVVVHGVKYSEATAKSMKLAKQLASVNFLREAIANRIPLKLEELQQEGAGGRAAALKAAVKAKTAKAAAAAAGGGGASAGSDGSGKEAGGDGNAAAATAAAKEAEAEATRLAMGDGQMNYAQLLHDLVAAHPETPAYTNYAYKSMVDPNDTKSPEEGKGASGSGSKPKGFRCSAKLLRHVLNEKATESLKADEAKAKAAADIAAEKLLRDPLDEKLQQASKAAETEYKAKKAAPLMDILVLTAEGDGASKRDAKHKAAEAMIYVLLPECKNEAEMRAKSTEIMQKYQAEKKVRMEEEQRVAQKEKAERIARRAADKAKRAADKKAKDAALAEGNTSSEVDVEGAQVASSNGPNDDSGAAGAAEASGGANVEGNGAGNPNGEAAGSNKARPSAGGSAKPGPAQEKGGGSAKAASAESAGNGEAAAAAAGGPVPSTSSKPVEGQGENHSVAPGAGAAVPAAAGAAPESPASPAGGRTLRTTRQSARKASSG